MATNKLGQIWEQNNEGIVFFMIGIVVINLLVGAVCLENSYFDENEAEFIENFGTGKVIKLFEKDPKYVMLENKKGWRHYTINYKMIHPKKGDWYTLEHGQQREENKRGIPRCGLGERVDE